MGERLDLIPQGLSLAGVLGRTRSGPTASPGTSTRASSSATALWLLLEVASRAAPPPKGQLHPGTELNCPAPVTPSTAPPPAVRGETKRFSWGALPAHPRHSPIRHFQ
jgi:hypothetical protein